MDGNWGKIERNRAGTLRMQGPQLVHALSRPPMNFTCTRLSMCFSKLRMDSFLGLDC